MESRKLGLDKGGRADHRTRREAFAVKFWEREREPTGAVPQPENYTSSFFRRARGGVAVGTRVGRADGPGVWCCISGQSAAPNANIRKAVSTERRKADTEKGLPSYTNTEIIYRLHAETSRERDPDSLQCIRNGKWNLNTQNPS